MFRRPKKLIEGGKESFNQQEQIILDTFQQSGIPKFVEERDRARQEFIHVFDMMRELVLADNNLEGGGDKSNDRRDGKISSNKYEELRTFFVAIDTRLNQENFRQLFSKTVFCETYVEEDLETKKHSTKERKLTVNDVVQEYLFLRNSHGVTEVTKRRCLHHIDKINKMMKGDRDFKTALQAQKDILSKENSVAQLNEGILPDIDDLRSLVVMYHGVATYREKQKSTKEEDRPSREQINLLDELSICLEEINVNENGIQNIKTLVNAQNLWGQIQDVENIDVRRREQAGKLKRIRLQVQREVAEMLQRVRTYILLYSEKNNTNGTSQINEALEQVEMESNIIIGKIKNLLENNHVLDLDMNAVEEELLHDFREKKEYAEMIARGIFRGYGTEQKVLPAKQERELDTDVGKPFVYDKEKAREYGMAEIKIPTFPKAQELFDKIIAQDSMYVTTHTAGSADSDNSKKTLAQDKIVVDKEKVQQYWNEHCTDLPNIPEKSWWYFEKLVQGKITDTIDNDSNIATKKTHTPHFGTPTFLLMMDYPEFDWDSPEQKKQTAQHPSMKLLKKFCNTEDPTNISRNEINTSLWANHDTREQSPKARAIIAELLNKKETDPDIDNYELRLIRQDEYMCMTSQKGFGNSSLWTHMDGYNVKEDGERFGCLGGLRGSGGAAGIAYAWRGNRPGCMAVRLVLQRKQ